MLVAQDVLVFLDPPHRAPMLTQGRGSSVPPDALSQSGWSSSNCGCPSAIPQRSTFPTCVGFHKTLENKSMAYPQVLFPFNLGFII